MRTVQHQTANIETLEGRRLMSVGGGEVTTQAAPDQGIDLNFLSDIQNDTTPVISQSVDPVARVHFPDGFHWLDGTGGRNLMINGGRLPYVWVDGWNVWPRNSQGVIKTGDPDETNVRAMANEAVLVSDTLVIDIENWQTDLRYHQVATINQNIARFENIIRWIREEQPSLKVGIYSIFPISDLYSTSQYEEYSELAVDPVTGAWFRGALPGVSNNYARIQTANEYLRNLSTKVDYIFPALYTSSPDIEQWLRYARNTVYEARRYNKPVIPFIMPTYHAAAVNMNRAVVSPEMWQTQLDYMQEIADGTIIWTDGILPTDPSEYWIQLAVAEINGTAGRSAPAADAGTLTPGQMFSSLDGKKSSSSWGLDENDSLTPFNDELLSELQ